ncbi:MAG: formylglycine-generating enzyme family protein [Pseudomonadota bacterium]
MTVFNKVQSGNASLSEIKHVRSYILMALLTAAACQDVEDKGPAAPSANCRLADADIGTFVTVPAGQFLKGASAIYPEEGPTISLTVDAFDMQVHEVTNAQFEAFVSATGHETDAERSAKRGGIEAGSAVFRHTVDSAAGRNPWALVSGATWRTPFGPDSDISGKDHYPVIHVSLRDAKAYAEWAGGRLPNEVEWELAAQLGLFDETDQTSGAFDADGRPIANTWQGIFPYVDTGDDGATGLAPAGCYQPSKIGLYDMIGNAWEWTDTPFSDGTHTVKGGSFLCADNFCRRYRPAARQPQESDFSSNHIGFRIIRDVTDS